MVSGHAASQDDLVHVHPAHREARLAVGQVVAPHPPELLVEPQLADPWPRGVERAEPRPKRPGVGRAESLVAVPTQAV